jgi:hypothetical protein
VVSIAIVEIDSLNGGLERPHHNFVRLLALQMQIATHLAYGVLALLAPVRYSTHLVQGITVGKLTPIVQRPLRNPFM